VTGKASQVGAVVAAVIAAATEDRCPVKGRHCEHHAEGRRPCCHCGASPR
jgi:hypothetical protein